MFQPTLLVLFEMWVMLNQAQDEDAAAIRGEMRGRRALIGSRLPRCERCACPAATARRRRRRRARCHVHLQGGRHHQLQAAQLEMQVWRHHPGSMSKNTCTRHCCAENVNKTTSFFFFFSSCSSTSCSSSGLRWFLPHSNCSLKFCPSEIEDGGNSDYYLDLQIKFAVQLSPVLMKISWRVSMDKYY